MELAFRALHGSGAFRKSAEFSRRNQKCKQK
jgi:hypothetical protein